MKTINEILISFVKCKSLYLPNATYNESYPVPTKLIGILGQSGYILSDKLKGMISPEDEERLYETLSPYLKDLHGLGRRWRTVYMSPEMLPEDNDLQRLIQVGLYMNPELFEEIRNSQGEIPALWETNSWDPKHILEGSGDGEIMETIKTLLGSPIPLSFEDTEFLSWVLENREDLIEYPESIPCKEILAMTLSNGYGENFISGVTDILRSVFYMSTGVGKIEENIKIKLTHSQRKIILRLLRNYLDKKDLRFCVEDAMKYKELWKRISEVCHPKEQINSKVYNFFKEIHYPGEMIKQRWGSKLQKAYDQKNYKEVLRLFSQRPSEFIRHYDSLIRRAWETGDTALMSDIQEAFIGISGASPKVLFDLHNYYDRRGMETERSYLDKKGIRHLYEPLKALDEDLISIAQKNIRNTIFSGWSKKDTFKGKKVILDISEETEFPVTWSSGGGELVADMFPGQIVKFERKGILRFFSHWIDPYGNEDLDLHAYLLDDTKDTLTPISWNTSFRDEFKGITHSGDVRHQQGDCAEYVTVDFSKPIPYTWMLVTIQNFDGSKLSEVENWIGISKVSGKEISSKKWVPTKESTVFRGKITSEAKDIVGFIVNLQEGYIKLILEGMMINSLDRSRTRQVISQYITKKSLPLRDLLSRYIKETGGEIIETPTEEEDIITIGIQNLMSGEIHGWLLG